MRRSASEEERLHWIQLIAFFASWRAHPGRFVDGRLENEAVRIGERLVPESLPSFPTSAQEKRSPRILHVATRLYAIGGHTRLINNWIKNDSQSCHSIVAIDQADTVVPTWLQQSVDATGGQIYLFPQHPDLRKKAGWLRLLARERADAVILHHHPDDVIPLVAFAVPGGPPVAVMNHADHVFWLGSAVADTVISIRGWAEKISRSRRFARHLAFLPIPLSPSRREISREEARHELGVAADTQMLLSIGEAFKYVPSPRHNFYQTAQKILSRRSNIEIWMMGVSSMDAADHVQGLSERIHLLGRIEDPAPYLAAADLYLEGFPYPSLTATLDSAAAGLCPVLMFSPSPQLTFSEDPGFGGYVKNLENEEEYLLFLDELLLDPERRARLSDQVRTSMVKAHTGEQWRERLDELYSFLLSTAHHPSAILETPCLANEEDMERSRHCASQIGERLLLADMAAVPFVDLSGMLSLLSISVRAGDTRLSKQHLRTWAGVFKHRLLDRRSLQTGR